MLFLFLDMSGDRTVSVRSQLPPVHRGGLRFDKRLLLVYGLLLLDVVVIGSTSLQHVWQPANLIDKVLQNHSVPPEALAMPHPHASQQQLPVAVKRELGMSFCCGWLALAVMGALSLLLSYSPSAVTSAFPKGAATDVQRNKRSGTGLIRGGCSSASQPAEANDSRIAKRTFDEIELQMKLKYLLVAVATFCVFFALNLVVQIHGRFQQSKVTAAALKTFAANNTEEAALSPGVEFFELPQANQQQFSVDPMQLQRAEESATGAVQKVPGVFREENANYMQAEDSAGVMHKREDDGSAQSPPYFYWRDFFFWTELGRECFLDSEILLSGVWVLLHVAALMGGRRVLYSHNITYVSDKGL